MVVAPRRKRQNGARLVLATLLIMWTTQIYVITYDWCKDGGCFQGRDYYGLSSFLQHGQQPNMVVTDLQRAVSLIQWQPLQGRMDNYESCLFDNSIFQVDVGAECFAGVRIANASVIQDTFYELKIACLSSPSDANITINIRDENTGQLHPKGADFHLRCTGAPAMLLFRTFHRTRNVSLEIAYSGSNANRLTISHLSYRALGSTKAFTPPPALRASGRVIATMATRPERFQSVLDAASSILPFVDAMRIFCNGCDDAFPVALLQHQKLNITYSEDWEVLGDTGKFFRDPASLWDFDLHFTVDDDILYPTDYVVRMTEALQRYDMDALVGVHCVTMKQPFRDYYDLPSRTGILIGYALPFDVNVHIIGTGTLAYSLRRFNITADTFPYPNMADIWLAVWAQRRSIPRLCVKRDAGWLQQSIHAKGDGIWAYSVAVAQQQPASSSISMNTAFMQNHVLRQNFPLTKTKLPKIRPKVVLGILTWNRVEYLRALLQSFFDTRSSDYDWVLIIADDGSTDGTLEYLDNLSVNHDFSTELHVIKNNGSYACGQTNDIFELSNRIGFDYGFKADDDVVFLRKGWDHLYIAAMERTPYKHLCYLNLPYRADLVKRQNLTAMYDPPVRDVSGLLSAAVDGYSVSGALFTFSPEVIEKAGFCDEANFPIRGQWHIDLSLRYARAGFNSIQTFFDAAGSNEYISLQEARNKSSYKSSLPWGDAYKQTREPGELRRRTKLLTDDERVFIPAPRQRFVSAGYKHQRVHNATFGDVFEKAVYLNLENAHGRRALFERRYKHAGIIVERVAAIGIDSSEVETLWSHYSTSPFAQVRNVRRVETSKQVYHDYDSPSARTEYFERRLDRKALTKGGMAYSFSWIKILRDAVSQNVETVVIFDDDAVFHKSFNAMFQQVHKELPENWMILYLGALQYSWSSEGSMPSIVPFSRHLYRGQGSSIGSHAVALRKAAFPWILRYLEQFQLPLDDGALSMACHKFADRCFTAFPNLVIQDFGLQSSINSSIVKETMETKCKQMRWNVSEYDW